MKFTLLRIVFTAFLLSMSALTAKAQPYLRLTANDFEGMPHPHSGVIAYTNCTIDFHYTANREDGYYHLTFNIQLLVNRERSWMDKERITSPGMLAEILKHEQGHYNIAYMEQQEMLRELSKTHFGADYQRTVTAIFNRIDAKYKQLNLDYDEDTAHMTNRVQQHSWDVYFRRKLEFMPPA